MFRAQLAAVRIGLGALRENPLRTLLATLGVIIGVAALVAVLTLGDAMQGFVRGELERTTDVQTVTVSAKSRILVDGEWEPVHGAPQFTPRDADALLASVPEARAAAMSLSGESRIEWAKTGKHRRASVSATTAGMEAMGRTQLAAGRLFTATEAAHNAPVIVLSHKLAEDLSAGRGIDAMMGEFVKVRGLPRQVIGVFAGYRGENSFAARVPFASAAAVLGADAAHGAPSLMLKARSVEALPAARRSIEDWLASRYRDWEGKVDVRAAEAQLQQVMQGFDVMKLFLGALAAISLLVGGIGIMNIMLSSVTERTREIGVRKAIGARGRDIRLQFLTEAVIVSCFGSAVGVLAGAQSAAIILAVMRIWTRADGLVYALAPETVLLAALSAVTIGVVFGTYPALRAERLSPIDAIRHE